MQHQIRGWAFQFETIFAAITFLFTRERWEWDEWRKIRNWVKCAFDVIMIQQQSKALSRWTFEKTESCGWKLEKSSRNLKKLIRIWWNVHEFLDISWHCFPRLDTLPVATTSRFFNPTFYADAISFRVARSGLSQVVLVTMTLIFVHRPCNVYISCVQSPFPIFFQHLPRLQSPFLPLILHSLPQTQFCVLFFAFYRSSFCSFLFPAESLKNIEPERNNTWGNSESELMLDWVVFWIFMDLCPHNDERFFWFAVLVLEVVKSAIN